MKICLISPYESVAVYGLRILSSALKQGGHSVEMLFLPLDFRDAIPPKALEQTVEHALSSELAGLSLSSNYMQMSIRLTRAIKKRNRDALILWGGIHPTIDPSECLQYCDIACVGEAEEALRELAQKMEAGLPCTDTLNFHFKTKDGNIIANPVRPLNPDLDTIPFPDYSNQGHFMLHEGCLVPVTSELLDYNLQGQYLTLTSRGCMHSCAFCCNNFLKNLYKNSKLLRFRSVSNIIEECVWVKNNLPWAREILFDDDAFMARSKGELEEFSREWPEKVGIPFFVTGITPATLNEEKLNILLQAGLRRLRLGIQTASDRVNYEIYKRPIPHTKALKAIEIIERHKDQLSRHHYDIIVDNPWETEEENLETLRFLLKIPRPWAINICSLTFFPGTELFQRAQTEGIVTDNFRDIYNKSYKSYRPSYINRLFYFFCQSQLPVWVLGLFVNKWILRFRLHYPLWWFYIAGRNTKHLLRNIKARGKKILGKA